MKQIVTRKAGSFVGPKPEILAPAGNRDAFLAALAAGADAVYCGLKSFSARMAARNFTLEELAALRELAGQQKTNVYVTLNTLVKPDELIALGRQLVQLTRFVKPDALIVQDLAVIQLARQAGFNGEIHLSTLANVTLAQALPQLSKIYGVQRVVLPRELNVDEIKLMAAACPKALGLELFVHGALCYGVSGRCYWSSFLGGKSGLRGRCVQPCRRRYTQKQLGGRLFSCQDFSLDVLVKALAPIVQVRAWKIEGRKKGPHYVYYTVTAYQMLRDEGHDPQARKAAVQLLEQALGRPGTHYHFLPQRPRNPIDTKRDSGSGLLVGLVRGGRGKSYLEPRMDLLAGDKLRIGYEDDAWHQTLTLVKAIPKQGRFFLKFVKGQVPDQGSAVFLIDRREPALAEALSDLEKKLADIEVDTASEPVFNLRLPPGSPKQPRVRNMTVLRRPARRVPKTTTAMWFSPRLLGELYASQLSQNWWWLPPVIWPDEENECQQVIRQLIQKGARRFVLNAPWQMALFKHPEKLNLWAGPFCNITNALAIRAFKLAGGQGVIVSPELGREDMVALPSKSVLPLGVVISGFWPYCVSRVLAEDLATHQPFTSPRGEQGWVKAYSGLYWVFPNWRLDLKFAQDILTKAGYRLLVHLEEPAPRQVQIKHRPGRWNWEVGLK